jgi:transposase
VHRQGWNISALAREFNVSWRTARRYAKSDGPVRFAPRPCPAELNEEQLGYVVGRLNTCSTIRATTLYREVKRARLRRKLPSFARRVRALRDKQEPEPVVRLETDPGVQAQMEWATVAQRAAGGTQSARPRDA